MGQKPSVGRIVHYRVCEFTCLAAVVIDVPGAVNGVVNDKSTYVSLFVINPDGIGFTRDVLHGIGDGSWHWPERVEGSA